MLGTSAAIKQFELKVAASGTDLKTFALPLPKNLAKLDYSGNLDFDGIIAGTLQALKVDGDLALNNFRIAGLEFDRILTGSVTGVPKEGIKLDLAGVEDEIELALDSNYQPVSFDIALNQMNVSGIRRNDLLQMEADNLQIGLVKEVAKGTGILLPRNILVQPISGELSGDFAYNLKTSELSGQEVTIANPILGRLRGDRATGNFRYLNGNFILSKAQFQKNDSQYLLDGSLINTKQGPQLQAKASVSQGQIQDVLEALQIFELSDLSRGLKEPVYAKAADLYEGRGLLGTRHEARGTREEGFDEVEQMQRIMVATINKLKD
ncbi:MAG: hypothetical protein HC820_07740 [Hydrococcus sp. RM1_1_31]|nr:hypothetical protein [Hydrococcus sp. RM1_1_31]